MKGGGRAPPPSPACANFTLVMECTPESSRCYSVYSVEVIVNNKEENSKDFCLDFVQEFGLRKANVLPASFSDDHFSADTAKLGPQIPIF